MIYSLISMTVDSIYLVYFLCKSTLKGTYYIYAYLTGKTEEDMTEISIKELEEIKVKMEKQEKVLQELTDLMKSQHNEENLQKKN
jgi:hypothetical protein